ncbi:protein NUCLEOLAR COMPLEX ASSOCIATED 4 [Aristolochia californica]|uniref:protein NUCLEOLAR COMPLEX ASSOCIATED 4 n=1 Tax=Aristolochia californica TaxID=171875 RepID=UPI0035DF929C
MASILAKKQKKYTLKELKTLGHQLLSSRSYVNNIPLLLTFLSPSSPLEHALESLVSLQAFFIPLMPELPPSSLKSQVNANDVAKEDPDMVYKIWLRSKFDQFVNLLIEIVISPQSDDALKDVALDAVMEFVKLGKGGVFQTAIYYKLLRNAVYSTASIDFLLEILQSKFFKYIDVRYFTYVSLEKLIRNLGPATGSGKRHMRSDDSNSQISEASEEVSIRKLYDILSQIPSSVEQDQNLNDEMWSQLGISTRSSDLELSMEDVNGGRQESKNIKDIQLTSLITKRMKLKFSKAWMSFLKLPLPLDVYKEVLANLYQMVIPGMTNPVILSDFLTRSYDIGGVISVMALSGLFILMTQHGLEYPNFYEKLYALLIPTIFMAKHRAKFFELLDSCLKSTLLPAYMAAAFAKKLSRLSLAVPPSGSLIIIAIIHNLLRRHPSINCLVHQLPAEEANGVPSTGGDESVKNSVEGGSAARSDMLTGKKGVDLFKSEESDPMKSDAMRSSLWEVDTLRHHYCPAVSRFVASLETDLTVRQKTSEMNVKDFSSGSYATIFKSEIGRRVKQVPLAFYKATPTSLFSEADFPGWTFGSQKGNEEEARCEENGNVNSGMEDGQKFTKRQRTECS